MGTDAGPSALNTLLVSPLRLMDLTCGDDIITDFANNGLEKINLGAVAGINNIGNLTISNFGGGALITFGPDSIHVLGVTAAQLDNSDFIF